MSTGTVPARPAMPGRPTLPTPGRPQIGAAPGNVMPTNTPPVAQSAPPVSVSTVSAPPVSVSTVSAPPVSVSTVSAPPVSAPPIQTALPPGVPTIGVPTNSAPVVSVTSATVATAPSVEKAKRGRKKLDTIPYYATLAVDATGAPIYVISTVDGQTVSAQKRAQLESVPTFYAGTQEQANADLCAGPDWGYNPKKHDPLSRGDFKKASDYERYLAGLATQRAAWLLQEADAIDAGKSTKQSAAVQRVSEMRDMMVDVFATLRAVPLPTAILQTKFGHMYAGFQAQWLQTPAGIAYAATPIGMAEAATQSTPAQ